MPPVYWVYAVDIPDLKQLDYIVELGAKLVQTSLNQLYYTSITQECHSFDKKLPTKAVSS